MRVIQAILGALDSSGNFQATCYDEVTNNVCVINTEHHEIHEGHHFTCQDYDDDVDVETPKYWHIITPDTATRIHMTFRLVTSKSGTVEMFEGPTTTGDGTGLTEHNNDRNSGTAATLQCFYDPTVSDDGTRILVNVVGSDGTNPLGGEGGIQQREQEIILKQNEQYLVKFTSEDDNTRVSCCFEWYEES